MCVCLCGCVSLVELEAAAATVGDAPLPPSPHPPLTPLLVPLLLYKGDGGKRHLCHLALTQTRCSTDTQTSWTHAFLWNTQVTPGKKALRSRLLGLRLERQEERTPLQGASLYHPTGSDSLLDWLHLWGKLVPVLATEEVDRLPAMRIFNLIYLLLLLVALLASSYSARPGKQHLERSVVFFLAFFKRRKNFDKQINVTWLEFVILFYFFWWQWKNKELLKDARFTSCIRLFSRTGGIIRSLTEDDDHIS